MLNGLKNSILIAVAFVMPPVRIIRFLLISIVPALCVTGILCVMTAYVQKIFPLQYDALAPFDQDLVRIQSLKVRNNEEALDIAFLGDSSCLYGINPYALSTTLKVESYCTMAYAGPVSYAAMIEKMSVVPKNIVIAIHPIQFKRDPSWDSVVSLVRRYLVEDYMTTNLSSYVKCMFDKYGIYMPAYASYGRYYGNRWEYTNDFVNGNSPIDPAMLYLNGTVIERTHKIGSTADIQYPQNDLFWKDLRELAETLRLKNTNAYLLLTPVGNLLSVHDEEHIVSVMAKVAEVLNIPPSNCFFDINSFDLSPSYFASSTHLNRNGKRIYTQNLKKFLAEKGLL